MKAILILTIFLAGCATTDPDVAKSASRDRTMGDMTKIALINEMLNSPDPAVRLEGARAASEFVKKEKRSIFNF